MADICKRQIESDLFSSLLFTISILGLPLGYVEWNYFL